MNLENAHQSCIQVVSLGLFGIEDFNVICPTWDAEDFAVEEVARELLSLQSGRGNDESEVLPLEGNFLQDSEQNVSVDSPFMCLVQHDH